MTKLAVLGIIALISIGVGVAAWRGTIDSGPHLPTPDPATVAADPDIRYIADSNNLFGFNLLAKLHEATPSENVFFSPFSISDSLSMLMNGAGGQTQGDIATTLGQDGMPVPRINAASQLLIPSLENADPKVQVSIANALWAPTPFAPGFEKICRNFYGASATQLDLSDANAADTINDWVSRNTQGNIPNIVSPGDLAGATAVLTNAIYFHGIWTNPFDPSATQPGPFTLADGSKASLPMMSRDGSYPYLETSAIQAVSLPYGAGRTSLIVILPKSNLNALIPQMDDDVWKGWVAEMQPAYLTIDLPRFKLQYQATLNKPLSDLGMQSAFDGGADFAPMGMPGSCISAVLHKATIDVDEQGTTAAAATGTAMDLSAEVPPQIVFRVDHPFFCAIVDNLTGTILFMGAVQKPG